MLDTLFLSVLNMSITAGFVIFGVLLARLCLKKAPTIFSYALWAIVLFRLICPFSFESAVGLLPINETPIPQDFVYSAEPQINTGLRMIDDVVNPMLPVPNNIEGSISPLQTWALIGSVIWAIGITAMLFYSMIQFVSLKRKLIGASSLRDNIYLADHINSPFVMGFIKPKIYLPSSLAVSEQAFIIAHEQCHMKRLDHIARILAFMALAIHWFNPLVWLAFVLSGKDMEMSCDETVMKKMGADIRAEYSQSLLRFATGKKLIAATPLSFGEGDTKDRVKNVMQYKKPMLWVSVIAIIAVTCVAVGFMTNPKGYPILNPYVQEYIPGQGNIRGNVDVESYEKISTDFAIGADKYGVAVFKKPHKAFETFKELYADGIASLQKEYGLPYFSQESYDIYKTYGWQITDGTNEQKAQGLYISRFLDIYENSFQKSPPGTQYTEPTIEDGTGELSDLRPMVFVDGVLYLDTGKEESSNSVVWEGAIVSTVEQTEKPTENGQSNFGFVGNRYCLDDRGLILETDEIGIGSRFAPEKLTYDQAVASALFSLADKFPMGECIAEGHIILGYDDSDKNETKIYALTAMSKYGFENGNFVEVSGSAFPAVITLSRDNHVEIEAPSDGSGYAVSIEKMFPQKYHDRIFKYEEVDHDSQKQQREEYASAYLAKIGRSEVEIGDYSDFNYTSPTKAGVSLEASNKLEDFYKQHNYYPSFIGTRERLENGVRVVYEMNYEKSQDEIEFIKYYYDTKEIIEQFVVNAKTGVIHKLTSQAETNYTTEADFLNHPDGVKFQAVAYKAAKAYLNGDKDELTACISENCIVDVDLDLFKDIDYIILKWSLDDIKAEDKIHAAYEFQLKGEDSVSFVSMELVKIKQEWKVSSIGLEK